MQTPLPPKRFQSFFYGLGLFMFSASTVALVTDPYVMADIGLLMLSLYLMARGLHLSKAD